MEKGRTERLGRDSWGGLQLLQEEGFQANRAGSPVLPPFSPSSRFKLVSGAISLPEQNAMHSRKGDYLCSPGRDRPAVSREESDVGAKGAKSLHVHKH